MINNPTNYNYSQGATLLVTLILLLMVTLISISTIDTSSLQSQMSRNSLNARNVYQASLSEIQTHYKRLQKDTGTELNKIAHSSNLYEASNLKGITLPGPGIHIPVSKNQKMTQDVYIVFSGDSHPPSGYSVDLYTGKNYEINVISTIPNTKSESNQTQGIKRIAPR